MKCLSAKRQFSSKPTTETLVLNFAIRFDLFQGSLYGLISHFLWYFLLIRFGEKEDVDNLLFHSRYQSKSKKNQFPKVAKDFRLVRAVMLS